MGYNPDVLMAARRTNDGMGVYIAEQLIKLMIRKEINPVGAHILIMGLAFKENCPDLRNTRVVDIVGSLRVYNMHVDVCDPYVDVDEARREYGLELCVPKCGMYDGVVVAVGHDAFRDMGGQGVRALCKSRAVIYDVKNVLARDAVDEHL